MVVAFFVLLAVACGFAFRTASIAPAWLRLCLSSAWSAVRWFFAWFWSMDNPLAFVVVGGACLWLNKGLNMYMDAVRRKAVVAKDEDAYRRNMKNFGVRKALSYMLCWPAFVAKDFAERFRYGQVAERKAKYVATEYKAELASERINAAADFDSYA